jgi:hypothetical protein
VKTAYRGDSETARHASRQAIDALEQVIAATSARVSHRHDMRTPHYR